MILFEETKSSCPSRGSGAGDITTRPTFFNKCYWHSLPMAWAEAGIQCWRSRDPNDPDITREKLRVYERFWHPLFLGVHPLVSAWDMVLAVEKWICPSVLSTPRNPCCSSPASLGGHSPVLLVSTYSTLCPVSQLTAFPPQSSPLVYWILYTIVATPKFQCHSSPWHPSPHSSCSLWQPPKFCHRV